MSCTSKSILIAPIASLLAGFVIGTNFLAVYSTDDSSCIQSLGDAILISIPAYARWRFDESMKTHDLQNKIKRKEQPERDFGAYSAAAPNCSRFMAELLAILGMAAWFLISGLLFVLPKTYEVLCENPSPLEPIMSIPLLGHALRFFKAYW